jgi:phenylacetate-coenzyme A ligase PaaK-like adenylate-forming protein
MHASFNNWGQRITSIKNESDFNELALEAFHFQFKNLKIYREYCKALQTPVEKIEHYTQIPFLPISFFKTHKVISEGISPKAHFKSSGTTGFNTSNHFVHNPELYEKSFTAAFHHFYGDPDQYCILALLPSYVAQGNSSLVYMAQKLTELSKHPKSGFYLNNYEELSLTLQYLEKQKQKTILLGVTYALLDLAEQFPQKLTHTLIMETGGMKGHRKEIIREALHAFLCKQFGVQSIHSEYGMTELLSQGYSKGNGVFETPPWLKILIRDTYDPFHWMTKSASGGINVIDLANIYSCCFIETADLGKYLNQKQFTLLGRFDNSDIRGCNLLVT